MAKIFQLDIRSRLLCHFLILLRKELGFLPQCKFGILRWNRNKLRNRRGAGAPTLLPLMSISRTRSFRLGWVCFSFCLRPRPPSFPFLGWIGASKHLNPRTCWPQFVNQGVPLGRLGTMLTSFEPLYLFHLFVGFGRA